MADSENKSSWLKKTLKGTFKLVATAGFFVASGYLGSLVFDPAFFPAIHDPNNQTGKALVNLAESVFGPVNDFIGLTGGDGLLQREFVQKTLGFERFYPKEKTPVQIAQASGGDLPAQEVYQEKTVQELEAMLS